MPVNTPMVMEIDRNTWLIQEYGLACCYGILGSDSGLLIDTGSGRMHIRKLAERLFEGRPYKVVLTHGHPFHAGGAGEFEQVFCAEELQGGPETVAVTRDFSIPVYTAPKKKPETVPLHTGDVFDLGGRRVLCIRTPGHSEGSCAFYDDVSRIAFVGDACGRELKLECVSDGLTGLMRLKRLCPELNRIYPGHVAYTDCRALPASVLDEAIGACRGALAPDGHHYHREGKVLFRSVSLEYKTGWAEQEPHSPYPLGL